VLFFTVLLVAIGLLFRQDAATTKPKDDDSRDCARSSNGAPPRAICTSKAASPTGSPIETDPGGSLHRGAACKPRVTSWPITDAVGKVLDDDSQTYDSIGVDSPAGSCSAF
jgi:hypothetical protein